MVDNLPVGPTGKVSRQRALAELASSDTSVTAAAVTMAPGTGIGNSAPTPAPVAASSRRPRLHHVDYMRPFKQGVVITTHSLLLFAPAASATAGAALLVTHLGRFAFMFISAAMLVYAYPHLERGNFGRFWRRRLFAVAVPYALWTLFYFFWESVPGVSGMYRPTGGINRLSSLPAWPTWATSSYRATTSSIFSFSCSSSTSFTHCSSGCCVAARGDRGCCWQPAPPCSLAWRACCTGA